MKELRKLIDGKFNKPLDNWDVSNITNMYSLFSGAVSFNQPLDDWDVSNVIDMSCMFSLNLDHGDVIEIESHEGEMAVNLSSQFTSEFQFVCVKQKQEHVNVVSE